VELAVLAKAVPRSEAIRYEPTQRTVVRDGAELVLNPLDQRALRVALGLRRPGETVTVVSLGPTPVAALLREARAAGVDRAWHLCDPAFAASDLLATSAALGAALHRLRPGLVLAGARSTDSDTGLIGPEVAARLGIPVVSGARAIRRYDGSPRLEVDIDTERGWATVEVDLPAVVTVGEKIAKPLAATPEQLARARTEAVETFGPSALGLSSAEVGGFGSPTTVVAVCSVAPTRFGRTFHDGPIPDRVARAIDALGPLLGDRPPPPPPLPWPAAADPEREVVVLTTDAHGAIDPASLGVVSLLRRALPAYTVSVAAYGRPPEPAARRQLRSVGVLEGYLLDPGDHRFDSQDVADGLSTVLEQRPKVPVVGCVASPFGREVAGRLAAAHSLGIVADATNVGTASEGTLDWSKPSFGGTTAAVVRCRSRPVVVTIPRGLSAPATDGRSDGDLEWTAIAPPPAQGRVRRRSEQAEPCEGAEPDGAEVIVAVGAGIGGPEGIARIVPAVRRWGAALVGTRRVVDAGWLPVRRQVGLTGGAFGPRLAVLLGVRGAVNHMVGWGRAGTIVAVNRDADAPVFRQADVGLVGPIEEVVPELVEPLAGALGLGPAA